MLSIVQVCLILTYCLLFGNCAALEDDSKVACPDDASEEQSLSYSGAAKEGMQLLSYGLGIRQKTENFASISESISNSLKLESNHTHRPKAKAKSAKQISTLATSQEPEIDVTVRPNQGGVADTVEFAVMWKKFYGVDLKAGTVTLDIVLTLGWADKRVAALVPEGTPTITFATERAKEQMWLPDITVTNRDLNGIDIISSSVTVTSTGLATKVERLLVIVRNPFDVKAFPFDEQHLVVKVASTTLMADELTLRPLKDASLTGLGEDVKVGGYFISGNEITSMVEVTGSLRKSRGIFDVTVKRDAAAVAQSALFPQVLLVIVSWMVFFFPLLAPFTMPRVATSLICFLSLMTLSVKTSSMLPGSGASWINVFQESCQALVFMTVVLNVFVEVLQHRVKLPDLAEKADNELKIVNPVLTAVCFAVCLTRTDGEYLSLMTLCIRTAQSIALFGFVTRYVLMIRKIRKEQSMDKDGEVRMPNIRS